MIDEPRLVQHDRLQQYLLNPDHPKGAAKARFFAAFGFTRAEPGQLAAALDEHAVTRKVVAERSDEYGLRREVRCSIATPDGRNPCIVAVWFQPAGDAGSRLITAYPGEA